MAGKSCVVVKRLWHHPEIHAYVDENSVGARIELQDFIRALIEEMYQDKKRFVMLSKAEALVLALASTDTIIKEIKSTTSSVV